MKHKPVTIYIVVEPKRGDYNRIVSTSHTSKADAIRKALRHWLPEKYFPEIPGDTYYGAISDLWTGMQRVGWDITEVEIDGE